MSLHGLLSVTMGVPNVDETAAYYADFGLAPEEDGWFSTLDAGRQLRIVHAPTRRLVEMRIGVDDPDDLNRVAASLARLDLPHALTGPALETAEPVTGTRVRLEIAPRLKQDLVTATPYNGPGRLERQGNRAPGFMRRRPGPPAQARPRRPRHHRPRHDLAFLRRRARLQGQRPDRRRRLLPALLDRPPQRARAGRAGELPAPHVLAGG